MMILPIRQLMSAQNTHHIPVFDHVFGSFYLVISALYLILGFSCISGEKGGIWKLCGDLKKEIGGELSLNVATFQSCDVLTSRRPNIATLRSYDVHSMCQYLTKIRTRVSVGITSIRIRTRTKAGGIIKIIRIACHLLK